MPRERLPTLGTFVSLLQHPEYGVGRVVTVGPFALRVVFLYAGLRVFRTGDARALSPHLPGAVDVESLIELEAALTELADPVASTRRPANDHAVWEH